VLADRYELVRVLHEGKHATTYEAIAHGAHGFTRRVAFKQAPSNSSSSSSSPLLEQQARAMSQLHHAGIVAILDSGKVDDDQTSFQVLELVDGIDLGTALVVENSTPPPIEVTLFIIIEVAHALHYAHQAGIAHGDLTPSVILLANTGDVKVGGFASQGGGTSDDIQRLHELQQRLLPPHQKAHSSASAGALANVLGEDLAMRLHASKSTDSPRAQLVQWLASLNDNKPLTTDFRTKTIVVSPPPNPKPPSSSSPTRLFFTSLLVVVVLGVALSAVLVIHARGAKAPPPPHHDEVPTSSTTPDPSSVAEQQQQQGDADAAVESPAVSVASPKAKKPAAAPGLGTSGNTCFCRTKARQDICKAIIDPPECACWFEKFPGSGRLLLCPKPFVVDLSCPSAGSLRGKPHDPCKGYSSKNVLTNGELRCATCEYKFGAGTEGAPCKGFAADEPHAPLTGTLFSCRDD
jgi:hypothetical protein